MTEKKKRDFKEINSNYIRKGVRFKKEEYEKLEKKIAKSNLDFSNYTKEVLLKSEVVVVEIKPKADEELLSLIKYISNNLNQLTKALHTSIGVSNEPLIKHNIFLIGLMEKDINQIKAKLLK